MNKFKEMIAFGMGYFIFGNVSMLVAKVSIETQLWLWKKIDYIFKD